MKKTRVKKMILIIILLIVVALAIDFIVVRSKAVARFQTYQAMAKTAETSYGRVGYIDEGKGEAVLVIHGICTGYDQGYDVLKECTDKFRVIAPSRFGYPGSDMPENATVDMQVEAFIELLDVLNIKQAYVLATSAGGAVAQRFALLHPNRCKGLILYCSGYLELTKPEEEPGMGGPPAFFCNDFCMWMISPLFKPIMGMESDVIFEILPMKDKKDGIVFDGDVTNKDHTLHYENYDLRKLIVPVLIFHAKDDKLAKDYEKVETWSKEIRDCVFLSFDEGGHLMKGHEEEIRQALTEFTEEK